MSPTARRLVCCLRLALTAATAWSALPASTGTLDWSVTDVGCTLTTAQGSTSVPCSTSGWSPTLEIGWRATMAVTFAYNYSDDGLALTADVPSFSAGVPNWPPTRIDRVIETPHGTTPSTTGAFYEAASLFTVVVPRCGSSGAICDAVARYGLGAFSYSAPIDWATLFYSNNAVPDSVSGTTTVTLNAEFPPIGSGFWYRRPRRHGSPRSPLGA